MRIKLFRRKVTVGIVFLLLGMMMTGCGRQSEVQNQSTQDKESTQVTQQEESVEISQTEKSTEQTQSSESSQTTTQTQSAKNDADKSVIRVGALKGPTSMGLLFLQEQVQNEESTNLYEFNMTTAVDELLPLMVKGELDIALLPANVAGVLYQKTKGGIAVIDINTLGVLYMISGNDINGIEDLKGKTIYLTGKGTTPDYVLHYILKENGISDSDITLEYKSEATEVAALLAEKPDAIGLLPQPFVTAACIQNKALKVVIDMNEEWKRLQGEEGSSLVTGVTIVRKEFLEDKESEVISFLRQHQESIQAINEDPIKGAELAVTAGIVAKAPIAETAIPKCNLTYLDGEEMKQALSGYLKVLYEQNPESIGGALPSNDFYYVP